MANLVAAIEERCIGDILDMVEAVAAGIGFDVVAAKGEQRPYHMPLNRQDAMETREPRASSMLCP